MKEEPDLFGNNARHVCPALKMGKPGLHNVDAAIRSILQRLFALLTSDFATHLRQSKSGSAWYIGRPAAYVA
jgi:hypothetical protein